VKEMQRKVNNMKVGELIQNSSRYGWKVKSLRYLSEDRVILEFEKPLSEKRYHIYVLAGIDGVVLQGYNFFEDNVPIDAKTWDQRIS
jgi:hypothetical protein